MSNLWVMQRARITFAATVLVLLGVSVQAQGNASERAAKLRSELADMQVRQTELQTRLAEIDEAIKPENIERSLAGVGSTHPEDLREARRRQLEAQRKGIQTQLDSLAAGRTRLENSIALIESESYRQSAAGTNLTSTAPNVTAKQRHARKSRKVKRRRTK